MHEAAVIDAGAHRALALSPPEDLALTAGHTDQGKLELYPNLGCILTRPIDWELIEQQYVEMVRYATALAERTADPEAILRRFTRANVQHPTYAVDEWPVGRAADRRG